MIDVRDGGECRQSDGVSNWGHTESGTESGAPEF